MNNNWSQNYDNRESTSPLINAIPGILVMLSHLSIRNFVLIDRLEVDLSGGLTVVTGETGAGKSIVFDAMSLLVGGRASADTVRAGEDEAVIQGLFTIDASARSWVDSVLAEAGLEQAEELLVRRVVSRKGGNRVYVNDTMATVGLLARALDPLVEVVGQHEHLTMARPETHRGLIDRFGGLLDDTEAMALAFDRWSEARAHLRSFEEARAARFERIEFLRFQQDELAALGLVAGEFDGLQRSLTRARNLEKLRESGHAAVAALVDGDGSAVERLADAALAVERLAQADDELGPLVDRLAEVQALVDDVTQDVRRYVRALEGDDLDLDALESRDEQLRTAFRKYGCDEAGLIDRFAAAIAELKALENFEESLGAAIVAEAATRAEAESVAAELDARRRAAATRLFEQVAELLATLGMPHARLTLEQAREPRLTRNGFEPLEIRFGANAGEPAGPIGKIASGGELSRLMLAVKTAVSETDRLQTYTFDEVDSGIGGATAEVVGRMLARLARGRQVICVTHLAQIASFADHHFVAEKRVLGERTHSSLKRVDGQDRVLEIGRMVGGVELTDATLEHARTMLSSAAGASR